MVPQQLADLLFRLEAPPGKTPRRRHLQPQPTRLSLTLEHFELPVINPCFGLGPKPSAFHNARGHRDSQPHFIAERPTTPRLSTVSKVIRLIKRKSNCIYLILNLSSSKTTAPRCLPKKHGRTGEQRALYTVHGLDFRKRILGTRTGWGKSGFTAVPTENNTRINT